MRRKDDGAFRARAQRVTQIGRVAVSFTKPALFTGGVFTKRGRTTWLVACACRKGAVASEAAFSQSSAGENEQCFRVVAGGG